jgi:hypothetical protein
MQKKPSGGRRPGAGRPSNLTVSRKKKAEPWIPGVSEMTKEEMEKLVPPAKREELIAIWEKLEQAEHETLAAEFIAILGEQGNAPERLSSASIHPLYKVLAPSAYMDDEQARTKFRNETLQVAASLHAEWRKAAAGRAAGGKKRKAENAKKVQDAQAQIRQTVSSDALAKQIDPLVAELAGMKQRTYFRYKKKG